MTKAIQIAKYDKEIKSIRKNRKAAISFLISAFVLLICFTFPLDFKLFSVHWDGLKLGTVILLSFIILVIFFVAWVLINSPISASMDRESDPEKYIALGSAFYKNERLDGINASALSYLGNYEEALPYARSLIDSGNKPYVLSGYFCKFRCEYFKGEYDLAKNSLELFSDTLKNGKKMNSKLILAYNRMQNVMKFMLAIANGDIDTQSDMAYALTPWSNSLPVLGLVSYLKGIYAFNTDDIEEAFYNFKWVTKSCSKTVLAIYSREYISKINFTSEQSDDG